MIEDLLEVFDSWEPILKARQAKGLDNWKKLETIAGKLTGKQAKDITFTCSHPSHEGKVVRHVLGSTTGNLHWLSGYGNPAFHLADYHWQIVDPNMEDEHIKDFSHPARPEFWRASGLPMEDEGDLADGKPHPGVKKERRVANKEASIKKEAVRAISNYAAYMGVPSMGVVFGLHNRHVYKWSIVKNSFFAKMNPDFYDAMEDAQVDLEEEAPEFVEKSLPSCVLSNMKKGSFSENVYSSVANKFPLPGTLLTIPSKTGDIYGVVTDSSIDFYDKNGKAANVLVYDRTIKSLDLRRDGDIYPSVITNFALQYLHVDMSEPTELPLIVKGIATPDIEGIPTGDLVEGSTRTVVRVGDGWRRTS